MSAEPISTPDTPQRRDPWVPRRPSQAASGTVFLIPYSGCGASMYRRWPHNYKGVEFVPVELPGHETRLAEPNFESYEQLAKQMAAALTPYCTGPFGFFGHCGSALAAYEVAAELVRTGGPIPAQVFVSSEVAPQDGPAGRFLSMSEEELGAELESLMLEMGGQPSPEIIELYLSVLISDVEVNKRYFVPDPLRLPGGITAIGWTEDDEIPFSTMGGWSACGNTKSVLLDGKHHKFIDAPTDLLDLMVSELFAAPVSP